MCERISEISKHEQKSASILARFETEHQNVSGDKIRQDVAYPLGNGIKCVILINSKSVENDCWLSLVTI